VFITSQSANVDLEIRTLPGVSRRVVKSFSAGGETIQSFDRHQTNLSQLNNLLISESGAIFRRIWAVPHRDNKEQLLEH